MSRSIHKTKKGVFGGKSLAAIEKMIDENDSDVEDLGKKFAYKNAQRANRKLENQIKNLDQE